MDFQKAKSGLTLLIVGELLVLASVLFSGLGSIPNLGGLASFGGFISLAGLIVSIIGIVTLRKIGVPFNRAFFLLISELVITAISLIFGIIASVAGLAWFVFVVLVLTAIAGIFNILQNWNILSGCIEISNGKGNADTAKFVTNTRLIYIIGVGLNIVLALVAGILVSNNPSQALVITATILNIVAMVVNMFALIMYIISLFKSRKLCN